MQMVLLLLMCLALYPRQSPPLYTFDAFGSFLHTCLALVLVILAAEVPADVLARGIHAFPHDRYRQIRRYHQWKLVHLALVAGLQVAVLFVFHWDTVVRKVWGLENTVLVDEVLILTPMLVAVVAGWIAGYRVEQAIHLAVDGPGTRFMSLRQYVIYKVRQNLGLVFGPMLLYLGLQESANQVFAWWHVDPTTQFYASLSLGGIVILSMSWLLTRILDTTPLPAGPLRRRLEAIARRAKFRYTDILVWRTHGNMANAMVTGFLPVPRYVLLSDALLENLPPEEVEAVFGHEIGHIRHRHLPYFLAFFVLSISALGLGMTAARLLMPESWGVTPLGDELPTWSSYSWPSVAVHVGEGLLFLAYFWLVFGHLSRQCERQADVFGCKLVAPPDDDGHTEPRLHPYGVRVFMQALQRVAELNGINPEMPTWRHGSIASRIRYLAKLIDRPALESAFQWQFRRFRWVLLTVLAVIVSVLSWHLRPWTWS